MKIQSSFNAEILQNNETMTGKQGKCVTLKGMNQMLTLTSDTATEDDYRELVEVLQNAASAYYLTDEVIIDDATYDTLARLCAAIETAQPEWVSGEGVTGTVAAGVLAGVGDVEHRHAMLSLDNIFNEKETAAWIVKVSKLVGYAPVLDIEPKLDGIAISATYRKGVLTQLVTRGDGVTGEDVTRATEKNILKGMPEKLAKPVNIEIRGELIMTDADFVKSNKIRETNGDSVFANPRNAVAGTIRSLHRTYGLPLTFVCYDAIMLDGNGEISNEKGYTNGHGVSHFEMMTIVGDLGVNTTTKLLLPDGKPALIRLENTTAETLTKAIERISNLRETLDYGVDGAVIKTDLTKDRDMAGDGSKAPRWATAYKYPADRRLTKLTAINMWIGRTGRITPVAVLEPVEIGGVTITSATLNNPQDAIAKDVRIGDIVWVQRAGDVIPEIVGPDLTQRDAALPPWTPDPHCPRCGTEIVDVEAKIWHCPNTRTCGRPEAIRYWASRKAMDIDGLGPAVVAALMDNGLIEDVDDLYRLDKKDVAALEGFGETSAVNLIAALDQSKTQPLERVLTGLGIQFCGRRLSKRIVTNYPTIADVRNATASQLAEIDGIGDKKAEAVWDGLREQSDLIDSLLSAGLTMETPKETTSVTEKNAALEGLAVVITGSVPGYTRDSAKEAAEAAGARVASSVSGKTAAVLIGAKPGGSKITKAETLNIPIVDVSQEGAFEAILANGLVD